MVEQMDKKLADTTAEQWVYSKEIQKVEKKAVNLVLSMVCLKADTMVVSMDLRMVVGMADH